MNPQTLLDSTFFLIPSFMPKKGLDPQVSNPTVPPPLSICSNALPHSYRHTHM